MGTQNPVEAQSVSATPQPRALAVVQPKVNAMARLGQGVLFQSVAEIWSVAQSLADGGFGPDVQNPKKKTATLAMQIMKGLSLGLEPTTSVSNMPVVNGRISIMGDLALGLVRRSGLLGRFTKEFVGDEGKEDFRARITMERKDTGETVISEFSFAEARTAGLVQKGGPWVTWLKRMLYYRALGFAMRDLFSDILMGVHITEELRKGDEFAPGYVEPKEAIEVVDAEISGAIDPLLADEAPSEQPAPAAEAQPEPPASDPTEPAPASPAEDPALQAVETEPFVKAAAAELTAVLMSATEVAPIVAPKGRKSSKATGW